MASEEDNFDIDIYGDGGEDYGLDGAQNEIKAEENLDQTSQPADNAPNPPTSAASKTQVPSPEMSEVKQETTHSDSNSVQKIASTDQSAPDPVQLPKQAPQTQGLKRKDGADDRPVDVGATNALFVSELSWWVNDDDVRGWANQSQCEDELEEITFSEHKVNGKSKGQAYVLFKSPQAATATKQRIESFGEGQYSTKKFTVSYTNPYNNPFKTLPKDGPMRNAPANNNRSSSGAYGGTASGSQHTGYNNYRGNRGGGYNNRGGGMNNMTGFNRGGFQQPMASGFQGSGIGGFQGTPMGGMQSYGGFQDRGGMAGPMRGGAIGMRGGRGGMNPNGMIGMPMAGLGMGGIGAMNMNMPQMGGGGMGMQGMRGSYTQPHNYPTAHCVTSSVPTDNARSLDAQSSQYHLSGAVSASTATVPPVTGIGTKKNPSSAWASYTQYSPAPSSISPPAQFPSQSSPGISPNSVQQSAPLKQELCMTGTQPHFNPAFFPQGQQSTGGGDASWNPHGAKRTRQE